MKLNYILNTHHHHDHVGEFEIKKTNCKILGPEKDSERIPGIDIPLKNNDEFDLGDINFKIFEVPGHTSGHICFYSENAKLLFLWRCIIFFRLWKSFSKVRMSRYVSSLLKN